MRSLGMTRAAAMNKLVSLGSSGALLQWDTMVCDFAWNLPKDHFTKDEFVSTVWAETKKVPGVLK
jgi:hypothetical protein